MKLVEMILNEMKNVSKPQIKIFVILIETILSMCGRINFRNLSRYSGVAEKTFARWFNKLTFDFAEFNSILISKIVDSKSEMIAALDPSFQEKAGKKTWGKDSYWNGSNSRVEKGLEFGLCALIDVTENRGYALAAEQTPAGKEDELTRIDFYLSCIKKVCDFIRKKTEYLVCDGYFTKKKFVDGIISMGLVFIGKLRIDANLKMIYKGEQKTGKGRPRKFTGKCNIKELQGFEIEHIIDEKTTLYSGIFYHASLQRDIKVVAVQYKKNKELGTVLLFSTKLSCSAFTIFRYYKARFQIEFIFRDAKQHTGLTDCQARSKEALNFHYNASLVALNVVKAQDQVNQKNHNKKTPFSMTSHKAMFRNETVIKRFSSMLHFDLDSIKSTPIYNKLINYGTIFLQNI